MSGVEAGLARPGAITYLHIPAADPGEAARFYGEVFGWRIGNPDSGRSSFDEAGGLLSGAFMRDQLSLLPYVYVEDVAATVERIVAHGGEVVVDPYPEGKLTVATFRDPAGNVIGLWNDTTRAAGGAVAPVPEHLQTVTSRLAVVNAAAAIDFYAAAFGAVELGERFSAPDGTVIHAELRIGNAVVMVTEDEGYTALLCTYWPDVDAAWERAVAAGAEVMYPLADHFYGERGGRVRDPFGQEWMLSARLERLTAEEIAARVPR